MFSQIVAQKTHENNVSFGFSSCYSCKTSVLYTAPASALLPNSGRWHMARAKRSGTDEQTTHT